MQTTLPIKLIATGKALPECRVYSDELDKKLGKNAGDVQKKSGIIYRHHADLTLTQASLAGQAILHACQNANLTLQDIDLLIHVNGVPQQALPCTASNILAELYWHGVAGYDINASCVGFLPALQHAGALLNMGCYRRIAISACDLASRGLNWQDDETALIFGDGAGCAIVEKSHDGTGIRAFLMQNYPDAIEHCQIKAGGTAKNPTTGMNDSDFYFAMDGFAVFKKSSEVLPSFLARLLASSPTPLQIDDVDLWLVHQASHLGMAHMRKRLGIHADKLINIYPTHGNQVSASLPTVLHEAVITGRWTQGKTVAMLGTAAGLSVAGLIWQL